MSGAPDDVASAASPTLPASELLGATAGSPGPDHDGTAPSPAVGRPPEPTGAAPRRRRAVRPGAGVPDPTVDLRSADDSDVGWQAAGPDNDDERLRRDVPPHW